MSRQRRPGTSERSRLSDKPWWLMSEGELKIEDAKFALGCAESFKAGIKWARTAPKKSMWKRLKHFVLGGHNA